MSDNKYKATIGLEIHAELKTATKMFCNCKNDPLEAKPNVNICPICTGHPGTLPVINKQAVKNVLKVGLAISGSLADYSEFDRKNYFYPDIPKGYQISQYKYPFVSGGELSGVKITRIHLEEDTAKSSHEFGDYSLVDFNRAGLPLMELVTEPVIHDGVTAAKFGKELQLLLRTLGVGEANMEKGQMRVEANVSVSDTDKLGTKVEVKNLNSFKSVEGAINYEIERQIDLIESGGMVVQETRGWDENKGKTFSQRLKEESHDYRYFQDPDLPALKISDIPDLSEQILKDELPEMPWEKRKRYAKEFGLSDKEIDIYVNDPFSGLGDYFEAVIRDFGDDVDVKIIKLSSNYILSDLFSLMKADTRLVRGNGHSIFSFEMVMIKAKDFARLMKMIADSKISSRGAKDIMTIMYKEGGDPEKIAEKNNLLQKSDEGELKIAVQKVIDVNKVVAEDFKSGKMSALQFLIGQCMKETRGSANPIIIKKILEDLLR